MILSWEQWDASTRYLIKRVPKGDLISCGSRYISSAELNYAYAMVELELLALQWATEKACLYLLGAPFSAITDHQLLVPIVNGFNYDAHANARIQRTQCSAYYYGSVASTGSLI